MVQADRCFRLLAVRGLRAYSAFASTNKTGVVMERCPTADSIGRYAPDIPSVGARGDAPQNLVASALAQGLDSLAHGIALFDEAGTVRYANAVARTLLGRTEWLRENRWGAQACASDALGTVLVRVCRQGRRELLLPSARGPDTPVALLPVRAGAQTWAIAVFGREEICGPIELLLFSRTHQLTQTESRVLGQLCRGLSARAVALMHGVSPNTVLTQINAIRSKTTSASVRRLLDALARLPPLVALSPVRSDARGLSQAAGFDGGVEAGGRLGS